MLNASISLLLIQLINDVEIQPGPSQAQGLNSLQICQWNVQYVTDTKLEEICAGQTGYSDPIKDLLLPKSPWFLLWYSWLPAS